MRKGKVWGADGDERKWRKGKEERTGKGENGKGKNCLTPKDALKKNVM